MLLSLHLLLLWLLHLILLTLLSCHCDGFTIASHNIHVAPLSTVTIESSSWHAAWQCRILPLAYWSIWQHPTTGRPSLLVSLYGSRHSKLVCPSDSMYDLSVMLLALTAPSLRSIHFLLSPSFHFARRTARICYTKKLSSSRSARLWSANKLKISIPIFRIVSLGIAFLVNITYLTRGERERERERESNQYSFCKRNNETRWLQIKVAQQVDWYVLSQINQAFFNLLLLVQHWYGVVVLRLRVCKGDELLLRNATTRLT